jgi:hypothetical protein
VYRLRVRRARASSIVGREAGATFAGLSMSEQSTKSPCQSGSTRLALDVTLLGVQNLTSGSNTLEVKICAPPGAREERPRSESVNPLDTTSHKRKLYRGAALVCTFVLISTREQVMRNDQHDRNHLDDRR